MTVGGCHTALLTTDGIPVPKQLAGVSAPALFDRDTGTVLIMLDGGIGS
jgi:hypothetical protein